MIPIGKTYSSILRFVAFNDSWLIVIGSMIGIGAVWQSYVWFDVHLISIMIVLLALCLIYFLGESKSIYRNHMIKKLFPVEHLTQDHLEFIRWDYRLKRKELGTALCVKRSEIMYLDRIIFNDNIELHDIDIDQLNEIYIQNLVEAFGFRFYQ